MKCPRCGTEMNLDEHRKIAMNMCYNCGYIEGRTLDPIPAHATNFARLKALSFNEFVIYLSEGMGLDEEKLIDWLDNPAK